MDNNEIITHLQSFKTVDRDFLKDKDCLICLESVDLEMNQLVALPCNCANSTYHITCITQLLKSGENKNFCPHCKSVYQMPPALPNQVVPIEHLIPVVNDGFIIRKLTCALLFHFLTNSMMNIINICVTTSFFNKRIQPPELQAIVLFCFFKLFLNYIFVFYSKQDIEKMKNALLCSYSFQTVLFGGIIYSLIKIKNDNLTVVLIINNVLFGVGDSIFRILGGYYIPDRIHVVWIILRLRGKLIMKRSFYNAKYCSSYDEFSTCP